MRARICAVLTAAGIGACGQFLEAPTETTTNDGGIDDASSDSTLATDVASGQDSSGDASSDGAVVEKERVVFLSRSEVIGNALDGTKADDLCNEEANAPASLPNLKGKTFIAWLSVPGKDARDRVAKSSLPFRRVDGPVVAMNFAELVSGTLQVAINVDSTGGKWDTSGSRVWTGTEPDGTVSLDHCNGWTTASSTPTGAYGELNQIASTWTSAGEEGCDRDNHIYCIEK